MSNNDIETKEKYLSEYKLTAQVSTTKHKASILRESQYTPFLLISYNLKLKIIASNRDKEIHIDKNKIVPLHYIIEKNTTTKLLCKCENTFNIN